MPGKVNPTQCEAVTMVCAQVRRICRTNASLVSTRSTRIRGSGHVAGHTRIPAVLFRNETCLGRGSHRSLHVAGRPDGRFGTFSERLPYLIPGVLAPTNQTASLASRCAWVVGCAMTSTTETLSDDEICAILCELSEICAP